MKHTIKDYLRRGGILALSGAFLFFAGCSALAAEEMDTEAEALIAETEARSESSDSASGKEEVVYISLSAAGEVESINVVNIWGSGSVTDYGDYTAVKMLTTTDEITQDGDEITFTTDAERVYYQGTLDSGTELPWRISVTYQMDGTEYGADEIAGLSGELTLSIDITENTAYDGDFFDTFALQVSLTLDTACASNITADGATVADVGSDKQLSYIALPGAGLEAEITADVTDFEMDAVSINAVQMNLGLDIDEEELRDQIDEILDASEEIRDGSEELDDGADELLDGASELLDGADTLYSGVEELDDGVSDLAEGMETLQSGLETLNANSSALTEGSAEVLAALETIEAALSGVSASTDSLTQLAAASGQIQTGIQELYDGFAALQASVGFAQYKALMAANGLDIDTLTAGNTDAAAAIEELIPLLNTVSALLSNDTIAAYAQAMGLNIDTAELSALADTLITLLNGNNAAISGMESYLNSVSDGVDELADGIADLNESYQSFHAAIETMTDSLSSMVTQLTALQAGIETLVDSYTSLDDGINDYTDGVAEVVAGYQQILDGVSSLASGSKELLDGSGELADGTQELYDGVTELCDGTSELLDGTTEFYDALSEAEDELDDELWDLIDALSGEGETVSFVSAKNTEVEAVQFVFTTSAVAAEEEEEAVVEEEEESGIVDKFLDLFR